MEQLTPKVSSPTRWLMLAFAVVAAAFVASTAYSQRSEADIDRQALQIVTESLPSVDTLSDARAELRAMRIALEQYLRSDDSSSANLRTQIARNRSRLEETLAQYIGPRNDEATLRDTFEVAVRAPLAALDLAVRHVEARVVAHDAAGAEVVFATEVRPAISDATAGIWRLVQWTNQDVHRRVMAIVGARKRSTWLSWALNALCLSIALGAALLAGRLSGQYRRFMETHQQVLHERAVELDQFAGRVAHDIANPLAAVLLVIDVLQRDPHSPRAETLVLRAQRSARKCQKLLEGLLVFARAGAATSRGTTDVVEVLDPIVEDLCASDDGDPRVEIAVEPFAAVSVGCSAGVLTSLFENLLGNAVKYSRGSPVRKITVRVLERDAVVRCEFADTGPGIPFDVHQTIFNPYVRGTMTRQPGLGLGLATVKRLCEAHDGKVGVKSKPGAGAMFWFELPRTKRPEARET